MVFNYVNSSNKPIFSTNKALNEMVTGSVEINKIFEMIDFDDEIDVSIIDHIDKIELNNITVNFDKIIFKNVNALFDNTKLNYIIGPNGSGKSVLLSLLYKKQNYTGRILVNNKEIKKINFDDISVANQQQYVFDRDVKYNLNYSNINDEINNELVDILNIDKGLLNNNINAKLLSGGEKRKISLYRCLNKQAKLYILDEPTNDLDIKTILNLKNYILSQKDKFIIIVTHDNNFIVENSNILKLENYK